MEAMIEGKITELMYAHAQYVKQEAYILYICTYAQMKTMESSPLDSAILRSIASTPFNAHTCRGGICGTAKGSLNVHVS